MSFDEHEDLRWLPAGEQVLVQRLRGLEWPRPDADLRERCWREFRRRVSELDGDRPPADAHRFLHDYTRRAPLGAGSWRRTGSPPPARSRGPSRAGAESPSSSSRA